VGVQKGHHEAKYDFLAWSDEIRRWHDEQRKASAMLAAVQAAWREAEAALEGHAQEVRALELELQRQERILAELPPDDTTGCADELAARYREFGSRHATAREAHVRLKAKHEVMLADIRTLLYSALSGGLVTECTPSLEN
jgi:hypothetical protein